MDKSTVFELLYHQNRNTPEIAEYFIDNIRDLPKEIKSNFDNFTDDVFFRAGQLTAELMIEIFNTPQKELKDEPKTPGKFVTGIKNGVLDEFFGPEYTVRETNEEEAGLMFDLGFGVGMALKSTEIVTANHFIKYIPNKTAKGKGGKALLN